MPTQNIILTDHDEKVISELVASGRYQNASEVLREGLRLIEERAAREAAKLKALQEAARIGFDDIDKGRFIELDTDDDVDAFMEARGRGALQRVSQPRD